MTSSRVAQRYALALIEFAEEADLLGTIIRDVESLGRLISGSPDFVSFLRSPVINHHKKQKVLTELLKGRIHEVTLKFVTILALKSRENLLGEILRQFNRLKDERGGIVNAEIRTVIPLTPAEENTLTKRLEKHLGKTIRMSAALDRSLRGGFTVRVDDTVWDASLRRRLEVLRDRFIRGG